MERGNARVVRAWTMYDWANSAYSLTITSAIFPIYYAAITMENGADKVLRDHGVPADSVQSYTLSLGFFIVAVLAPVLSGIADTRGNKLTYLKAFCYLGAISCAGLSLFTFDRFWLGMVLFMLACIGFSGSLVFYDAFLPQIAEPKDHDKVSARGYVMGYIGSVLLLILNLAMVLRPALFGIPDTAGWAARIGFFTVGVWWAGWAQVAFRALPKGGASVHVRGASAVAAGYRRIREVWQRVQATRRLKRFLLAFFVYNTGIQTVMYLAVAFAAREIKDHDAQGNVVPISEGALIASILIIQLVAAMGALLFARLSAAKGNLFALAVGLSVWVAICVGAYFTQWAHQFYLLAATVGLVMGGCQALSRSTFAKFLPAEQEHTSFFSLYDVSYYMSTVLGTAAYGLVFQVTGDLRHTVIAIGTFFVVGLLLLWRVPAEETGAPVPR
jgi:MFS transporter, UMF1 family